MNVTLPPVYFVALTGSYDKNGGVGGKTVSIALLLTTNPSRLLTKIE